MRKIFKASVSKVYIAYLLLLTIFVIGTYSSYAYFTVNKEKKNAIKMITGNLIGELKVDGETSDKLVVSANETKTFEVEVINKNNRQARFNFYYKGSLPDNVEAGYVSGDGYNSMVKEAGVNLTANGSLGYFLKYQIKVKNNTSGSITIPLGYEVGLDYNDLSLPSNCYLFEEAKSNTAVDILLANYTNGEDIQDYDVNYTKTDKTAKENKMYVFNHTAGTQQNGWTPDELKSYRYIGADPNNYVTFNDEVAGWRIIGIETVDDGTGKKEKRIKLIRKDLLTPDMSWDNKPNGTGSSEDEYGSNDWTDSRLMYLLNPNHETEQTGVSGSIYWNRQSGKCPYGSNNGTIACDFSEVGLLSEARKMIGDAKWFLGGTADYKSADNGAANHFYGYERGEETCTTKGKCKQIRKTNWTGRVGLMYPSDYGYATSGGSSANREYCLAETMYYWDLGSDNSVCYNNDWLYNSSKMQCTITSSSGGSDSSISIFHVSASVGTPNIGDMDGYKYDVRPVVYLKASTLYKSGDGSSSNPFVFQRDPSIDDEGPVCKFTDNSTTDFSNGGNIIVECTDDSEIVTDLANDSFYVFNTNLGESDDRNYDVTTTLSKIESIQNGKRYTFTVSKEENDSWITHCGNIYLKIKANSVIDKSGNGNDEVIQKVDGIVRSCGIR